MPVTASQLEPLLETALGARVMSIARNPCRYATTHPLEELHVALHDGRTIELILKDGGLLNEEAGDAKPAFLRDAEREVAVFRELLVPSSADVPRLYGSGSTWLLLERVGAPPLTEVGYFSTWEATSRRLAALHDLLRGRRCRHLLRYDERFYRRWRERARLLNGDLGAIEHAYDRAVQRLLASTPTVIHGELYASNILTDGARVWVLDWETAALGPALVDLAAFTSGSWDDDARTALALAYHAAMTDPPPLETFLGELECARLHLAVQWLGWSETWTPPPWQRHDWLAEGLEAAERIR
jgi:hypothetical protein